MMTRYFLTPILFFLFLSITYAQPKREFRGIWIANVTNIDWPSDKNLTAEQQQTELIKLLDLVEERGLNAVFFQVRNVCDAVYESKIAPWSEWLMGQQGLSPGYDPLKFLIAECRKRNIEVHAWLNPYRAVMDVSRSSISEDHIIKTQPDWILTYGNLRMLNPGLPQVRHYVMKVVMEVVRGYDIDGIHFDDYFYPYPVNSSKLNDQPTFVNYGRGIANKNDWRRNNIDLLVKMVSDSIKNAKPWVKFGISPFGIWQNKTTTAAGSDTKGFESYSGNFGDSKKWLEKGWIDYVVPQLYWNIGFKSADFAKLVPWWNDNSANRHLYIGHGLYRVGNDWENQDEIVNQIELARAHKNVKGSVFFSAKSLRNNALGSADLLTKSYSNIALLPTMPWKDNVPPAAPSELIAKLNGNKIDLTWNYSNFSNNELDKARQFVVYRFDNDEAPDMTKSGNILAIFSSNYRNFTDESIQPANSYTYFITALDRLQNESKPSLPARVQENGGLAKKNTVIERKIEPTVIQETAPTTENITLQVFPNPFNQQVSIKFKLESAGDVNLYVYDNNGARVGVLLDAERKEAGQHSVIFNGNFLSEGTYLARLMTKSTIKTAKIVLVK